MSIAESVLKSIIYRKRELSPELFNEIERANIIDYKVAAILLSKSRRNIKQLGRLIAVSKQISERIPIEPRDISDLQNNQRAKLRLYAIGVDKVDFKYYRDDLAYGLLAIRESNPTVGAILTSYMNTGYSGCIKMKHQKILIDEFTKGLF